MKTRCATPEAVRLFHEGTIALAKVEANGMRVDTAYIREKINETEKEIRGLVEVLKRDGVYLRMRKRWGSNANLGSKEQIGKILFEEMGLECKSRTETGRYKADEEAIAATKLAFGKDYLRWCKLGKALNTYLKGILVEVVDGYLHPSFNLNRAKTYRSSSSRPNSQNWPIRNPEIGKLIRSAFIPRPGRHIVELDLCLVGSTLVETLEGPITLKEVVRKVNQGELIHVYGYDKENQRIGISQVLCGRLTKKKAEVWRVLLDNGKEVVGTPDHKFMLRNGDYLPINRLRPGHSLMPFYRENKQSSWGTYYTKIYLNNGQSMWSHNLVALDVYGVQIKGSNKVVHHIDGNGTHNWLENLHIMSRVEHMRIHSKQAWENHPAESRAFEWHHSDENREQVRRRNLERNQNWTEKDWEEFGQRISEGLRRVGGNVGERNPMYGKTQSQQSKDKISKAKKGKSTGKSWNKGLTKETSKSVLKISESKRGKPSKMKGCKLPPLSEEHKSKISDSLKGRVFSEATRKKLSDNKKRYWKRRLKASERCSLCGTEFHVLTGKHLKNKHGISMQEYRRNYNHKVVKVESAGYEDVYTITVARLHNYAVEAGVIVKNCGAEVRISACYNQDPTLLKYIRDPTTDMHRDMAAQIYCLEPSEVSKKARYAAKNQYVFPQFYGSYYVQCAPALWKALTYGVIKQEGQVNKLIRERLKAKGIRTLGACDHAQKPLPGTFEAHLKAVEEDFWGNRFRVYSQWKKDWYAAYQRDGGFLMKTGFWVGLCEKRNDVLNYAVQGCLQGSVRVQTKEGLIPIRDLVGVQTKVWTGFRWADAIGLDRGVCQLATIKLSSGLTIHCDTRHKLKNERGEWVDFADLRIGSYVALPPNRSVDLDQYCYDRIEEIKVLDKEETTYTMSVDDPLHQFVADGVVHKNSAFHCLLWSLIRLQNWLEKYRMKTRIIGQIHDSIIADVPPAELQDFLSMVRRIFSEELPQTWKWIIVPIETECEVSPIDSSWYEKELWVEKEGLWLPAKKG